MKNILIIEDNEITLEIIEEVLISKFNIKASPINNVPDAIEILKIEAFDLIICDYEIGEFTGDYVLNYLREHNLIIPMIIFTGRSILDLPPLYPLVDVVNCKCIEKLINTIIENDLCPLVKT